MEKPETYNLIADSPQLTAKKRPLYYGSEKKIYHDGFPAGF